jgi:hypothetical protein
MSEYQYYEFRAIDRPLDKRAMAALRSITSRAEITPTSLVNVYHFGDFKGNPEKLMKQYFDAFLYEANWGTRRLMFRVPRPLFDPELAKPHEVPEVFRVRATPGHVVLDFHSENEDSDDFEGGEGWLASLITVRSDLLAGDLRALYLGWLSAVQTWELEDNATEPPIPPGLGKLSASLERLCAFLRIDPALVEVAAEASRAEELADAAGDELAAWVGALPADDKNQYLMRLAQGEAGLLASELLGRFRRERTRLAVRTPESRPAEPRTVAALREAAERMADEHRRRDAERAAKERERRARQQAADRGRRLDNLAGREPELWQQVEAAVSAKLPKEYDRALTLLGDLRGLAERSGEAESLAARVRELRRRHAGKWSFIKRLDRAGLPR